MGAPSEPSLPHAPTTAPLPRKAAQGPGAVAAQGPAGVPAAGAGGEEALVADVAAGRKRNTNESVQSARERYLARKKQQV